MEGGPAAFFLAKRELILLELYIVYNSIPAKGEIEENNPINIKIKG
jgi:hypothetical protein